MFLTISRLVCPHGNSWWNFGEWCYNGVWSRKYTYGIMYKTHMCMCIILMLSWICICISHDKYFIFVLFEIVVSRVLVKRNRLSCPVLSVSRVVVSVIKCRLLCFVGDDGRVLVVCSLGRWLRLMGIVLKVPLLNSKIEGNVFHS